MINWVLVIGVGCLGMSLYLTWRERRRARAVARQQVAAVRAMFLEADSSNVVDADEERNEPG